jgi:ribosomal protein L7Ae-like RNA K-turn-binding protein
LRFIISNDGDFSGVVSSIISKFNKKIIYVAVGNKKSISYHLKKSASSTFIVDAKFINNLTI